MDKKIIKLNIVTPEGIVFSHRAHSVNVMTKMGGLTILPNHIPIVTALEIGPVAVKRVSTNAFNFIAVNGGMLEFNTNECNIIADTAERARDIDLSRAMKAKDRAEKELHNAEELHDEHRMLKAKIALTKAINRIGVSGKYKG